MNFPARRIVTGIDQAGRAVAEIDEVSGNRRSNRPGLASFPIWSVDRVPADARADMGDGLRDGGLLPGGVVFRINQFEPGCKTRRHTTESIDFGIVLSGEIVLELDEGEVVLRAGDVLVQRATLHNWINRGAEPCVMAFVLVGAGSEALRETTDEARS